MAIKLRESNPDTAYVGIKQAYQQLLARFAVSTIVIESYGFSSVPDHHPALETILSESVEGEQATVLTHFEDKESETVKDYEYYLIQEAGQWRIEQIWCESRGSRHYCL